jgi:NAD(P)-dependent dehydrogenase (short-subunit alcohol dehydrogenase family)
MVRLLLARPGVEQVYACARDVSRLEASGATPLAFDLRDEESIASAAERLGSEGPIDFCFVATGLLHRDQAVAPEKSWRTLDAETMAEVLAINTIGPAMIAKHILPHMTRTGPAALAFLSARVGSIGDNRLGGWHAYRASKAALNMLVRNFAIELARTHPALVVTALHPGTVDTGLSKPFQRNVMPEKLFTPNQSAQFLLNLIEQLEPAQSGKHFAWDGQVVLP